MGRRLDFCESKQKRAQTSFLVIFHYPSGWVGETGLDPFDGMLKKTLRSFRPWPEKLYLNEFLRFQVSTFVFLFKHRQNQFRQKSPTIVKIVKNHQQSSKSPKSANSSTIVKIIKSVLSDTDLVNIRQHSLTLVSTP